MIIVTLVIIVITVILEIVVIIIIEILAVIIVTIIIVVIIAMIWSIPGLLLLGWSGCKRYCLFQGYGFWGGQGAKV